MTPNSNIVSALKRVQETMRGEMDRRGIALKAVSFDSGLSYSTLLSYFPSKEAKAEPALMPVSALYALCGAVPDDILSLLLPAGRLIVQAPERIDHDEIAPMLREYLRCKDDAHHPESEAGREIGAGEDNVLRGKFARVRAAA